MPAVEQYMLAWKPRFPLTWRPTCCVTLGNSLPLSGLFLNLQAEGKGGLQICKDSYSSYKPRCCNSARHRLFPGGQGLSERPWMKDALGVQRIIRIELHLLQQLIRHGLT